MVKASQTVLAYTKAPVSSSDTEITIRGLNDIYWNQAVMQGTLMYATIEPRSSTNQEIISFTDMVVVDAKTLRLTGCTRWLKAQDSETGTARDHGANVEFILSNNPQFYDTFAAVDEEETITAPWVFEEPLTVPNPVLWQEAVNLDTLNSVVVSGASDAGLIQKGLTRLSASPNLTIGNATITIATPAVVSFTAHGLTANDTVQFTTTGDLPTGLLPSTNYYVIATGLTADAFQLSVSYAGVAINTTGSQSGVHTLIKTTPVAVGVYDTRLPTQDENDAMVGTAGTPSAANPFVTDDDTTGTWLIVRWGLGSAGFFGNGQDWDVVIAAGTTTLTRDMFYDDLTLQTGAILESAWFIIFVAGILTQQGTGYIRNNWGNGGNGGAGWNGANGVNGAAGTAGAAWAVAPGGTLPASLAWVAGGAGGAGSSITGSNGAAGTNGRAATNALGSNGISGTLVGGGGGAGSAAGWSGGAYGTLGSITASKSKIADYNSARNFACFLSGTFTQFWNNGGNAGAGGGGGGSWNNNGAGGDGRWGGGGGGGGSGGNGWFVVVFAKSIVTASNKLLEAIGGNGGNGWLWGNGWVGTPSGGGGGGSKWAGWNGWLVVLCYKTLTTGSIVTNVIAGTPGTNGLGGTWVWGGWNGTDATSTTSSGVAGQVITLIL
jgi:hypothetical protein